MFAVKKKLQIECHSRRNGGRRRENRNSNDKTMSNRSLNVNFYCHFCYFCSKNGLKTRKKIIHIKMNSHKWLKLDETQVRMDSTFLSFLFLLYSQAFSFLISFFFLLLPGKNPLQLSSSSFPLLCLTMCGLNNALRNLSQSQIQTPRIQYSRQRAVIHFPLFGLQYSSAIGL